jgi:hypothetical protein
MDALSMGRVTGYLFVGLVIRIDEILFDLMFMLNLTE